jgi:hypothetical protein
MSARRSSAIPTGSSYVGASSAPLGRERRSVIGRSSTRSHTSWRSAPRRAGGNARTALSSRRWRSKPGAFHRALRTSRKVTWRFWHEASDELDSPVARARLRDLLWERRVVPRPDLHARAAADALLELVALEHWHVMERTTCLSRALELANTINDDPLRTRAVERIVPFIEAVLAAEGARSGGGSHASALTYRPPSRPSPGITPRATARRGGPLWR